MKIAELSGTFTMPADKPNPPALPTVDKMTIKKTGGITARVDGKDHHNGEHGVEPETNTATEGHQAPSNPQAKVMKPHVDVSGFEPPKLVEKKASQLFALGDRYPLDSYAQVKAASAYFDEWGGEFSPSERHTFAVNTLQRVEQLGLPASESLKKHGSTTYAPMAEIEASLDIRKLACLDDEHKAVLSKMASLPATMQPEDFAALLEEFDKTAGINHLYDQDVPDPYFSTFGFHKQAEFSETIGNMMVSAMDLEYLANKRLSLVKNVFTEDFANDFLKNPVDLYKSLPIEQRKILGNMAREQRSGAPGSG